MRRSSAIVLAALCCAVILGSCSSDSSVATHDEGRTNGKQGAIAEACSVQAYTLYAGQTTNVGTLDVTNDGTNLYVTFSLIDGWLASEMQLWCGSDVSNVPVSGGGAPIPGQFPYKAAFDEGTDSYTFTIPLADLNLDMNSMCGVNMYIFAHASANGETLWSFGTPFSQLSTASTSGTARWGWYSTYAICCQDENPDPETKCNTAFAKGGYVFTTDKKSNPENLPSLKLTKNRWGWAINVSANGSTTYDLWAGAGLNNTSKGTKVGTVTVSKSGSSITVSYSLTSPHTMKELHVYCGDTKPTTLAPGQYGTTAYFSNGTSWSETFSVTDSNNDGVWLICHAVACSPVN